MNGIGRVFSIFLMGFVVSMVGAAVTALSLKRRFIPEASPDADEVRLAAIFEPISFESRASSFRGGEIELWYGGGIIDLRGATLAPEGATLRIRAVFGGAQLLVPEIWRVTTRVMGIGGAGDGRPRVDRALRSACSRSLRWLFRRAGAPIAERARTTPVRRDGHAGAGRCIRGDPSRSSEAM